MAALMAHDGGSWLQAWPGPGTQAAPSGRKSPWAPGGLGAWALPYQKAISACF